MTKDEIKVSYASTRRVSYYNVKLYRIAGRPGIAVVSANGSGVF
jgi:hypothetical protein